jgi:hypothetical protein
MMRVANIATHEAGVRRPNGDVQAYCASSAVATGALPCTPVPNRCPDLSLNAR